MEDFLLQLDQMISVPDLSEVSRNISKEEHFTVLFLLPLV